MDYIFIISAISLFLFVVAFVYQLAKDRTFPPEAWLMVLGVFYGMTHRIHLPELPVYHIPPKFVFMVALPILIFSAGLNIRLSQLKKDWVSIGFFSTIGVVISAFLIGVPMAYIMNIPLLHGLLFGSALSATDPGSVNAILNRFKIPESLHIRIEGTSIFNDGTTVVLFALFTALVFENMEINIQSVATLLTWKIFMAIPIGIAFGWISSKVLNFIKNPAISLDLSITVILAFLTNAIAEEVCHTSGVIAVLFASMFYIRTRLNSDNFDKTHDAVCSFWNYINFITAGIIFLNLGVGTGEHDFPISWVIPATMLLIFIAQAIQTYSGSGFLIACAQKFPLKWQNIMILGSLRGNISVALVLSLPLDYEHRIPFLCGAFLMVFTPLMVQPYLLKKYLDKQGD